MAPAPLVDVIIPIHDATRPLARTIDSLGKSGLALGSELRINVVCHNIAPSEIRAIMSDPNPEGVRLLECHDGLPSPAGPRIVALAHADGRYISFVDSDDLLQPGALSSWVELAERHALDAVIPREHKDTGAKIRTPVVRPWRSTRLDPLRDRLAYRTAPLGLLRRATIDRVDAHFESDVRNGSDQLFALKLWFGDTRIGFARSAPSYVVSSDAVTRVSTQHQPLSDAFKATLKLFANPWFLGLEPAARRAIVVKFIRVQFMAGVALRLVSDEWTPENAASAKHFIEVAESVAPGHRRSLSRADLSVITAIQQNRDSSRLSGLSRRQRAYGRPATLITGRLYDLLRRDAPLRFMTASALH